MPRIVIPLLSGLAVGLAFGLSANSWLTYPVEKPKDEILYQGQPASYWIAQLKDRDPWFRPEKARAN